MASPNPRAEPSSGVYFTGRDDRGHEVALRQVCGNEVACGSCSARDEVAGQNPLARDDAAAVLTGELAQIAFEDTVATSGADDLDLATLYPAAGSAGHDCSTAFPGPLWLVSDPAAGVDARPVVVSLYEALEHLPAPSRQAALEAHLRALNELYDHLSAAESLIDGRGADDYLASACLACLSDPEAHLRELDADLTLKTLDLAPVLRAFNIHLTLGTRRPAGPLQVAQ